MEGNPAMRLPWQKPHAFPPGIVSCSQRERLTLVHSRRRAGDHFSNELPIGHRRGPARQSKYNVVWALIIAAKETGAGRALGFVVVGETSSSRKPSLQAVTNFSHEA